MQNLSIVSILPNTYINPTWKRVGFCLVYNILMRGRVNKNMTIDFICLVENLDLLLEEDIKWKSLKVNKKVSSALKELHLTGCTIYVESHFEKSNVIDFLEENDLIDFVLFMQPQSE